MSRSFISQMFSGASSPSVILLEDEFGSSALPALSLFHPTHVYVSKENAHLLDDDLKRLGSAKVAPLDEDLFIRGDFPASATATNSKPLFFSIEHVLLSRGLRALAASVELLKRNSGSSLVVFACHVDCLTTLQRRQVRSAFDAVVSVAKDVPFPDYTLHVQYRRKGNKMIRGSDQFLIEGESLTYTGSSSAAAAAGVVIGDATEPKRTKPAITTTDHLTDQNEDSTFLKPFLAARQRVEMEVEEDPEEEDLDDDLDF